MVRTAIKESLNKGHVLNIQLKSSKAISLIHCFSFIAIPIPEFAADKIEEDDGLPNIIELLEELKNEEDVRPVL